MKTALRFLPPLWTADAGKTPQRAVGTGLIGSLRWWYEALVRGLGLRSLWKHNNPGRRDGNW